MITTSMKSLCWACSTKGHLKKTDILPLKMGGTDDQDNIVHLCDLCHTFIERRRLKDSDDPDPFLEEINRDVLNVDATGGQHLPNSFELFFSHNNT